MIVFKLAFAKNKETNQLEFWSINEVEIPDGDKIHEILSFDRVSVFDIHDIDKVLCVCKDKNLLESFSSGMAIYKQYNEDWDKFFGKENKKRIIEQAHNTGTIYHKEDRDGI